MSRNRNAQFWVYFEVTTPDGETREQMVALASPDLANTVEARRRAIKTAEMRLRRKMEKTHKYGVSRKAKVVCKLCRCVG